MAKKRKSKEKKGGKAKAPQPTPRVPGTLCDGLRPKDKKSEEAVKAKEWKMGDLGELPAVANFYGGCIQGDRVTLSLYKSDRNVLVHGNVEQIVQYAIGKSITVLGRSYQRNIGRKHEEAVGRIRQEVTGKGREIEEAIQKQGPKSYHDGYTVTVNGKNVTGDSVINSLLTVCTYIMALDEKSGKNKPKIVTKADAEKTGAELVKKKGAAVEFLGGVDVTVSAIIIPGKDYTARQEYQSLTRLLEERR